MFHRASIRVQLFALALAIALPLGAMLVFVLAHSYWRSRDQAEAELLRIAETTGKNLDAAIRVERQRLEVLARRPLIRALDPDCSDPILRNFLELHPEFVNLVIRNRDGETVCSLLPQRPSPAAVAREFPWLREVLQSGRFTAGPAHLGRSSGRWVTVLAAPIFGARGEVVGTLGLPLDLLELQKNVLPDRIPPGTLVSVFDSGGRYLMRSSDPVQWIGKSAPATDIPALRRRELDGLSYVTNVDGRRRINAFDVDTSTHWVVTAGIDAETLFAPMRREIVGTAAAALLTLLAAMVLARRFGLRIREPVSGLVAAANDVAEGNLSARAPLGGPPEIAAVAQVLNRMLDVRERSDAHMRVVNRTLAVLSECNAALVRATDEQQLLDEMCRIVVERGGHALAWVGYVRDGDDKRVVPAAMYGATPYLEGQTFSWDDSPEGRGPSGTAIRTGQAAVLRDARADPRYEPWRERAERFGLRSSIALPLGRDSPAFGLLNIYSRDAARFDDEEVRLLSELAADLAYGIQALRGERRRNDTERALQESEERFRQIAENVSEVFWLTDAEKKSMLYVSPAYERVWQRSARELYRDPRQWLDSVHPEDRQRVAEASGRPQLEGRFDEEYRILRPDGSVRWIRDRAFPVVDATGTVSRIAGVAQDITDRKLSELRIGRLNRTYAVLSQINAIIVRVKDREDLFRSACRIAVEAGGFCMAWIGVVDEAAAEVRPVAWNGAVGDYFETAPHSVTDIGPGSSSLAGAAVRELKPVIANDTRNDPRIVTQAQLEARGIRSMCIVPLQADGKTTGVLGLYASEPDFFNEQEMALLADLASDISFALEHISKSEAIDYLAYYDVLTGVANRTLFQERASQSLKRAVSDQSQAALVMLDVERFKAVNDSMGRQAGDELLRQVARRLSGAIGDTDAVGRVGADQFALLLSGLASRGEARHMIEARLRDAFAGPFDLGTDEALRTSVRAGVALFPRDGTDIETLFQNAEAALKQAKTGADRLYFYKQGLTEQRVERLSLENKLRLALERDELVLHYQPKIDVMTYRVSGMEALIRWRSPELGLVPPGKFIPLLEEIGLIMEVGSWALQRAARDHARWREAGLDAPRVAVNVSPVQLRRPDFVSVVQAAIGADYGSGPIDLEITEGLIMEDVEDSIEKLDGLRQAGIRIAIDDFGTGYSSLRYLARLPVHTLKVDQTFIATMLGDPNAMTVVSTIISLAHLLGLRVVAEGVETQPQAQALRGLRCDELQGYLIQRPVPAEEMLHLLREWKPGRLW